MNYKKITVATLSNQANSWWWFFEGITRLDAEGDGDQDILVGMTGAIWNPRLTSDPKPYVIENLGDGKFQMASKWAANSPEVSGWINNLVVGDFNEDGINDVLVVDHGREDKPYDQRDFAQPTLYLSSKQGWIQTSQTIATASGWTAVGKDFWHGSINSRDFNSDGHLDIVMTALGSAGLELWLGDGRGNFSDASKALLPDFMDRSVANTNGGWASFGITGFIDAGGDGKQDIFALPYAFTPTNSNGYIALNSASSRGKFIDLGNVAKHPSVANNANRGYAEALVFDFDGNGLEDIVAIAEASNGKQEGTMYLLYLSQDQAYTFNDRTVEKFGSYSSITSKVTPIGGNYPDVYNNSASTEFSLGDYNGDGYMDINLGFAFCGRWNAINENILLNDGRGNFHRTFQMNVEGISGTGNFRSDGVGDLNGDGYADIYVVDSQTGVDEISLLISNASLPSIHFTGGDQSESLKANHLNNQIQGYGGDDLIDGGAGVDTAIYFGIAQSLRTSRLTDGKVQVIDTVLSRNGTDTLTNVERLKFTDTNVALDVGPTQNAGSVYMIYKAAFNRAPDASGMGYWLAQKDNGSNIVTNIAQGFVNSAEFTAKYGTNPSNASYIDKLYQNVLGRSGDSGGIAYWNQELDAGRVSKAAALAAFATLPEGASNVASLIANGIPYTEFVG